MTGFFQLWARVILTWPRLVLLLGLLSVAASLNQVGHNLKFSTDRTGLLNPEHPVQRSWKNFRSQFGGNTDLVVLISGSPPMAQAFCDQLASNLKAQDQLFEDVIYRVELPQLASGSLYYLPPAELERLEGLLRDLAPWANSLSHGNLGEIKRLLENHQELSTAKIRPVLPLLHRALQTLNHKIEGVQPSQYISPLPKIEVQAIPGLPQPKPGQTVFYNQVGGPGTLLLIAQPKNRQGSFGADQATVEGLRKVVANTMAGFPSVDCMVSGEPVINTDEMVGAANDAFRAGLVALLLVSVLLSLAFGDAVRPAAAVFALLMGLSWAFCFACLQVGTLNLLTVHFGTILVGLSMTFAIQLLSHFQNLRCQDPQASSEELLKTTVIDIGSHSLVGALTTAIAFGALHFTDFRAAAELGEITGAGVIFTFVSIFTFLPPLLLLQERWLGRFEGRPLRLPGLEPLGLWMSERPKTMLSLSLLMSLYSLSWFNRVPFNYNVLTLQSPNSDSVKVERYLQGLGYSTLYAVSTAPSLQEAKQLVSKFEGLPTVARVDSIVRLVPDQVAQKQPIIERIVARAQKLPHLAKPSNTPLRAEQLLDLKDKFDKAYPHLLELLPTDQSGKRVAAQLQRFKGLLNPNRPGPLEAAFREYQLELFEDLHQQLGFLEKQRAQPPLILEELPPALRNRSISTQGRYCIRIFPAHDCWERESLEAFCHSLEKVDPQVTGSPFLIHSYLEELRRAYSISGRNALAVICLLLLLHFRSLKNASLALFPKLLGVVWMIGAMGVAGFTFNAANFLALPITLGIGLIFGVNVLLECQQSGAARLYTSSTASAVVLAGMSATVGFSSFLLAEHVGVSSFGFVMAAGVAANLVTSLVTLPALLSWRGRPLQS